MEKINDYIDNQDWGKGAWTSEPNMMIWTNEETSLTCIILRSRITGALCGYVGVNKGHLCFGVHYDDLCIDIHGGLTFSGHRTNYDNYTEIDLGLDEVWWIGFDCSHYGDYTPIIEHLLKDMDCLKNFGVYRDIDFVKNECKKLAKQIKEYKNGK